MKDSTTIRRGMAAAKEQLEASQRVLALTNDPEFREIILGSYINDGLDQLLTDRVHPNKQSEADIALNTRHIDGIASFKGWLNAQIVAGSQAEGALEEMQLELDRALEAEANGDNDE